MALLAIGRNAEDRMSAESRRLDQGPLPQATMRLSRSRHQLRLL